MARRTATRTLKMAPAVREGPPPLTWDGAVTLFLQEERLKGRRPRTLKLHREILSVTRKDFDQLGAPALPAELGREHIAALVTALQDAGRQPRTINLRLQTLRQLFAFLVARGNRADSPTSDIPEQREPRRLPRALDDRQVKQLLTAPDRTTFTGLRDHAMLVLLLDTGMRLQELIQLEVGDLHLDEGTIHLRHRLKDNEDRLVYVSPAGRDILRRYLRERGALNTQRVFVSRDEKPMASGSFQTRLEVYARATGVPVSCHRLRHTFARGYILNGGDPFSLQSMLGHADMSTVRRYCELWGKDVRQQHDRFTALSRYDAR